MDASARIERRRTELQQELTPLRKRLAKLESEYEAYDSAESKAWAAYESAKSPATEQKRKGAWVKAADRRTRHVRTTMGVHDTIRSIEKRIANLDNPVEVARETEKETRLQTLRRNSMAKKETAKDRGVPDVYLGDTGNFKPGLDARYKSDLVNSVLGEKAKGALMEFTPADAEKRLQERGWMAFLDKARSSREAKAEAKAKREAEKAEAKASTKAEGGDEVTPDPKPAPRKRTKK